MPKMKTIKSAVKRFKRTGTGKVKRFNAFANHILKKKSNKRKRSYRRATMVSSADEKRILKMI
jgi:large subunit ribosomal protein L35